MKAKRIGHFTRSYRNHTFSDHDSKDDTFFNFMASFEFNKGQKGQKRSERSKIGALECLEKSVENSHFPTPV